MNREDGVKADNGVKTKEGEIKGNNTLITLVMNTEV